MLEHTERGLETGVESECGYCGVTGMCIRLISFFAFLRYSSRNRRWAGFHLRMRNRG